MGSVNERELKLRRDGLRREWREVRDRRLVLKKSLAEMGQSPASVRGNIEYRELMKKQHGLSILIKHIEQALNRKAAYHAKKKSE